MCRILSILSTAIFALAAFASDASHTNFPSASIATRILTDAAQVRALKPEEASLKIPVHLQGVVLLRSDISFTIADPTAGIYIECPPLSSPKFTPGDLVDVTGHSDPGQFAPCVRLVNAKKIGTGGIPEPQTVSGDDLLTGQFDAQWVEVSGVVRRQCIHPKEGALSELWLMTGGTLLPVNMPKQQAQQAAVDSAIRIRGVCYYQFNKAGQALSPVLNVPPKSAVIILRKPPEAPYDAPVMPLRRLMQFNLEEIRGHRIHVQGVVTHRDKDNNSFWIRDAEQACRVSTVQPEPLEPGARVDVLGFVTRGGYTPSLADAVFQKTSGGPLPKPLRLSQAFQAFEHDSDLVALEASIQSVRPVLDGCQLSLFDGKEEFAADLQTLGDKTKLREWLPGSRVNVTGICSVNMGALGRYPGILNPQSFRLLLRSSEDIRVLQRPSWWTQEHIAWLLGISVIFLLVVLGSVFLVSRQRLRMASINRIKAEAEFSAVWNERNRMARELHDTLAQGLGAISIQLEVVKRKIPANSEGRKALDEARALARSNLADARRAIWNMRSQVLETGDLAKALEDLLTSLTANKKTTGRFLLSGQARRLAPITENNLLRIGQECMVNAVSHAEANRIDVHLDFGEQSVSLSISDDGRGFDAEHPPKSEGGFGLSTLRERAEQMHGSFKLTSQPGKGTTIQVTVPVRH